MEKIHVNKVNEKEREKKNSQIEVKVVFIIYCFHFSAYTNESSCKSANV